MSEIETAAAPEEHTFQTEIQQLLELMIHSLYTHEEIFLRELISNASDALNKVQFEQLTNQDVVSPKAELGIEIIPNLDEGTLTLKDTGIGMSRDELVSNLGTIARSGSKAFLQALKDQGKDGLDELIGQFGVGFYSAFMVADKVTVETRSYRAEDSAAVWTSEGKGTYTIEDSDKAERGTSITLHLKDDAKKYLEQYELERIVKHYSDYVSYPITLDGRVLNRQKALWLQKPSEVEEEQYHEFYGHLSHDNRAPLKHLHLHFEAPLQFDSILYIPPTAPDPMAWEDRDAHGVRLYARRVFIQENCKELVPSYLRFLVGVVDSADLPLNVSRETIQNNPLITNIRNNVVRKVLGALKSMAKQEEGEDYITFYKQFGRYLKQGYTEDFASQDKIRELLRFNSSHHVDSEGLTSLKDYVERMREGQDTIYYANGESREAIERSPNLEVLKEKGFEVLYMTDPIDGILMGWLTKYDEKDFTSIDSAKLDLKRDNETPEEVVETAKDLAEFIKKTLGDKVEDVRLSERLVSSPVCLVNPESALSSDMQRVYKMMDKSFAMAKKILELNPTSPLIQDLSRMYEGTRGDPSAQEGLRPWAEQLFDMALLAEGLHPDPAAMVPRMQALMSQASAVMAKNAPEPTAAPAKAEVIEGEPEAQA